MNACYERDLTKLARPVTRSDGGAVRALDRGIHGFSNGTLVIALSVDSRIVCLVIRREHAVFDERSASDRSKGLAEAHVVVALVSRKTSKATCIRRATFGPMRILLGHFVLQCRSRMAPSAVSTRYVVWIVRMERPVQLR